MLFPFTGLAETKYTEESIDYTLKYFFPENHREMKKIASCESGLDNTRNRAMDTNGFASRGLLQINEINGVLENWHVPYNNIKKAREIYDRQGYRAWTNCAIMKGLIRAT